MKPLNVAPIVALLLASVAVAAPPYTVTIPATGVTVTTAQNRDNLRALSNLFTQAIADYALALPGTTTLPGICTPPEFRIDTDATAACRLYLCTSSNTWTAQCGSGGGSGDVTGVGSCTSGQCDSFTLTSTSEPLLALSNNDTGTTTKTILSLKRGSVASVVFIVGDDKGMTIKEADGTTTALSIVFNPGDPTGYFGCEGSNDCEFYAGSGADMKLKNNGDGALFTGGGITLVPTASPPFTCDGAHEGAHYWDTSHAGCACDGTTWTKYVGAGTCS